MAKLQFIGRDWNTKYKTTTFNDVVVWLHTLDVVSLDTETNVVDTILTRELKVISLGDEKGDTVFVLEFEFLTDAMKNNLFSILRTKLCIIHNVAFDFTILKKYGLELEKVYDTMLAEQVQNNGISGDEGFSGLQAVYLRRFDLDISKDEQTSFGTNDAYTDSQIEYAGIDVLKLGALRRIQLREIAAEDARVNQKGNRGLKKTLWWENEFVKAVSDMSMQGVRIFKDKWFELEDNIMPVFLEKQQILDGILKKDFLDLLIAEDWYSEKDELMTSVWTSSKKKKELLDKIYPFEVEKTSKTELKKYLQEYDPSFPEGLKLSGKAWDSSEYPNSFTDEFAVIKLLILMSKVNKEQIEGYLTAFLLSNLRSWAIEQGWVRPAGKISINWASPVQRLKVFQAINPSIESTSKEILEDWIGAHDIIGHYLVWADVAYKIKSYGKSFYSKYSDVDGKFRTRFRQLLATGRLSSTSPNLLAIPHDFIYRDCFVPDPGFVDIGADYDGEELVITGTLAGETVWLEAFKNGWDLHSINAENIFKEKWVEGTLPDCAFTANRHKCKCPEHQKLRDATKTLEFGQVYGMGAPKLAFKLKITERQAHEMIKEFFDSLPNISEYLDKVKLFSVENGYIIEPVFGRIRYFDAWKLRVQKEVEGVRRAAANYTIQASGSAVLKIAVVLIRRWIRNSGNTENIQLKLPVHDEVYAQARPEYVELAREKVAHYMELAGKLAGFDLKAEALSGSSWGSVH